MRWTSPHLPPAHMCCWCEQGGMPAPHPARSDQRRSDQQPHSPLAPTTALGEGAAGSCPPHPSGARPQSPGARQTRCASRCARPRAPPPPQAPQAACRPAPAALAPGPGLLLLPQLLPLLSLLLQLAGPFLPMQHRRPPRRRCCPHVPCALAAAAAAAAPAAAALARSALRCC